MASSGDQVQSASPVRRASWPITTGHVLDCLSNSATQLDEKTAGMTSTSSWRGSWWSTLDYNSVMPKKSCYPSPRSRVKRRRSRAVAKPPITQLSAQDKAHFKRIVQLFTGLGSSAHAASHPPLLSSHPPAKNSLASSLLCNTSSCSSPLLPLPLSSSSSSIRHPLPRLANLCDDLDIISALRTPITSRRLNSRLHVKESGFSNESGFGSNPLLPRACTNDLSPIYDLGAFGVHYHDMNHKGASFKGTSNALTTQIPNTPPQTTPSSITTPCSSDYHPHDHVELKSSFALKSQVSNTYLDNTTNSTTPLFSSVDSDSHIDLKSLLASSPKDDFDMKPLVVEIPNSHMDANHLQCMSQAIDQTCYISCGIDDGLLDQIDVKPFGAHNYNAPCDALSNSSVDIYCEPYNALNNHAKKKPTLVSGINIGLLESKKMGKSGTLRGDVSPVYMGNPLSGTTSPKHINLDQEAIMGVEVSLVGMDGTRQQSQQRVEQLEDHVKELESFLLKENDKVDFFSQLFCFFLDQNTSQMDQLTSL